MGGTTTATGIFGFVDLPTLSVQADPIRRSIGHIIRYSERPVPCSVPFKSDHYTVENLLSVRKLDTPVVFSSGFSRTGWGYRTLINSEIGQAYDLPASVEWEARFAKDILPLQLFRVVIETVWKILTPEIKSGRPTLSQNKVSTIVEDGFTPSTDATWLGSIEKWLPGTWADAPIADRAAKSDNALVDLSPWYNRIRLVLPCPLSSLVTLEELGMKIWRRGLTKSFIRYLKGRYGSDWRSKVARGEQRRDNIKKPSAKRRKVVPQQVGNHTMQGVKVRSRRMRRMRTLRTSPSLSAQTKGGNWGGTSKRAEQY